MFWVQLPSDPTPNTQQDGTALSKPASECDSPIPFRHWLVPYSYDRLATSQVRQLQTRRGHGGARNSRGRLGMPGNVRGCRELHGGA